MVAKLKCVAQFVALLFVSFSVLMNTGCNLSMEQDPATTVTLTITGISDEEAREEIKESLVDMTDGSFGHRISMRASGATMTIKLSPVHDVESFSKKINFGKVTAVEGRTVKVECMP